MRIQIEPGQRLHKFKIKLQYKKNNNNISTLPQQWLYQRSTAIILVLLSVLDQYQ